jgi:uncharacterized membrane protein
MSTMIVGLLIFLGVHSIAIVAPAWRDATAARLGMPGWKGLYSVVSLVGFWLMLQGYATARLEPTLVWVPPTGLRHVAALLMLPVFPLLLATYLPGRIRSAARHPMLAAVKFWALAHLVSNGMLADIVLFGSLLAWAVVDRISLKRRAPRPAPAAPATPWNDVLAVALGLALYAGFVMNWHHRLFGVSPFG